MTYEEQNDVLYIKFGDIVFILSSLKLSWNEEIFWKAQLEFCMGQISETMDYVKQQETKHNLGADNHLFQQLFMKLVHKLLSISVWFPSPVTDQQLW